MKYSLIFLVFSLSSFQAKAGIELLVGVGIGKLDFAADSPRADEYTGTTYQVQGTARGTLTTGRVQIGAGVTNASGKVELESDTGEDSATEFKHLYYGPVIGYIINKNMRVDFEYYTDSTIEITKTDDNSSDIFAADDKIFGNGFGVGLSWLRGHFITQVLYQSFSPDRVEINEVEYAAGSDEAKKFNIQNISLQIGLLF